MSTVGAHFDVQLGKMLDAARDTGDRKAYLGNRAVKWGRVDISAAGQVSLTRRDQVRYRLRTNDLLVCEGGEVGRAAIWQDELDECYYQKALHRLRAKAGFDPRVMMALLDYWSGIHAFDSFVTRTSIAHLPRARLLRIPLPIIPQDEQERIAAALDDASRLIVVLENRIAKSRTIKQAMMQQLLSGQTRLPGFTDPWRRATVGEIAEVKTGPFGSALHERDYVTRGTPMITVEHLGERGVVPTNAPLVSDGDVQRLRAYQLKAGDIVFSRVGSIDRNALITARESGWLFSGRLLRVRLDKSKCSPSFMSYQFHGHAFRSAVRSVAVGQTMPSLNTVILSKIPIDMPVPREQMAIGLLFTDMNRELDALHLRLTKAKSIKQGMMQELLTGRTRLTATEEKE
jgi:type I restriction enzyme, S subunit